MSSAGGSVAGRGSFGIADLPNILNRQNFAVLELIQKALDEEQRKFPADRIPVVGIWGVLMKSNFPSNFTKFSFFQSRAISEHELLGGGCLEELYPTTLEGEHEYYRDEVSWRVAL